MAVANGEKVFMASFLIMHAHSNEQSCSPEGSLTTRQGKDSAELVQGQRPGDLQLVRKFGEFFRFPRPAVAGRGLGGGAGRAGAGVRTQAPGLRSRGGQS